MASKEIQQRQRQVETAVANRYPDLSKADHNRIVARILDQVAQTLNSGGHLAGITQLENGKSQISFLTIESITQQMLNDGQVS